MSKLPRRAVNLEESALLTAQERPRPFENRSQLYLMHFFFAFVSRMWDMGIVLLVAQLTNNSLFLVAITGLCYALAVFLMMGTIGSFLDHTNRIVAVRMALFTKLTAVTLAYAVCAYLNTEEAESIAPKRRMELLYSIPLLGAIAGLSFSAITQSIEKDWIIVLSAKDSTWLSGTNSIMTQIDLACSSLAPAVTGLLFAHQPHSISAIVLLLINAVSTIALYIYMSHLYYAWPALGQKVGVDVLTAAENLICADQESQGYFSDDELAAAEASYGATAAANTTADGKSRLSVRSAAELTAQQSRRMSADAVRINRQATTTATTGTADDTPCCGTTFCTPCACCTGPHSVFRDFLLSGCAGMMVSYSALYLTVLSFGSLMTVYVRWAGVSDDRLGFFRGLAALFGYLGAVIFPAVSGYLGLWEAAQVAIVYQFSLVAFAASAFFWARDSVTVYIVMFAVLFSRTGLWLFDLCVRQIAQETIQESVRGKVNGQWRSMTAFFEMAGYAAAVYVPEPEHFWVLTSLSASMIGFALVVFTLTSPRTAAYCTACCSSTRPSGGGVRIGPGDGYQPVPNVVVDAQPGKRRNGESLGGLEMQPGTNTAQNGSRK